jgi:hypothetical protein
LDLPYAGFFGHEVEVADAAEGAAEIGYVNEGLVTAGGGEGEVTFGVGVGGEEGGPVVDVLPAAGFVDEGVGEGEGEVGFQELGVALASW